MLNLGAIQRPFRLEYKPSTTSTMDDAAAMAAAGEPHLSAILAEKQSAGRGRQGKVWQTFPQHSLAMTFIIRQGRGVQLPLVASLAVHRALSRLGYEPAIKWPNDILLGGPERPRKVAGLLVDGLADVHLLGIGLNISIPRDLPTDLFTDFPGTFLEEHTPKGVKPVSRETVINTLFACLDDILQVYEAQEWPALAAEYTRNCSTLGHPVKWLKPDGTEISGTAKSLTDEGALVVETKLTDGSAALHTIHGGEIIAQGVNPGRST